MGNRLEQLVTLRQEAQAYIKSVLLKRGTNYQLIDPQDIEDEYTEEFYDLPSVVMLNSKYQQYDDHKIVTINLVNGQLGFETIDTTDYDDHVLDGSEFESVTWLELADLIETLEN